MSTTTRAFSLERLVRIYDGSNGDATTALYRELEQLGPVGQVAVNLFRASKTSARAKVYRRRAHADNSYGRKEWSMANLCRVLGEHASVLGIAWGWKADPNTPGFSWVLYVTLPGDIGQVSFHTRERGAGPDFAGEWDGVRGASADRILRWIARLESTR